MMDKRCGLTEVHDSHRFAESEIQTCSGEAKCGAKSHLTHTFTAHVNHWCPGVCGCGLRGEEVHGPGAHK